MKITFQSPPKNLDEKMISSVLRDYKILNCEVLVRDENGVYLKSSKGNKHKLLTTNNIATIDDFIDVIMKDHRKYIRCLYVYNKIDGVSLDFLNELAHEPYTAVMSCELDLGVQDVVDRIWKELRLIRLYTKRYAAFLPSFLPRLFMHHRRI